MIADSVDFARAEGKRVIYDAEHFFDALARRPRLRARVPARRGRRRGRERHALRHQRLQPAGPGRRGDRGRGRRARRARRGRHPHPQRRRVRGRQLARRGRGRRAPGAGHDQRLRRALRQRQPGLDPARAAAQARLRVRARRAAAAADRDGPLRRRAHQHDPDPDQPYVGRNAFAHKGGMHVAGVQADARTFEHIDPAAGRQQPRRADLRAVRQGLGARRAPRAPGSSSTPTPPSASVERVKEREHRGYHYEAADASFDLLLRREAGDYHAAVPARELPGDRREARRRQGRDRGHDQDLGRRRALRAHGRGQRPGERARPGAARRDRRARIPHLRDDRAHQLQGPHPRRAPRAPARSRASCSTPPTATDSWGSIGVSENIIEASWEALVDSLEYALPAATRSSRLRLGG